jgi:hypothetical protein
VISNVMGALLQALEITFFEVQRKNNNKKKPKKEKSFTSYKTFVFFSLWTPPIFKPHDFLIFYSFKII